MTEKRFDFNVNKYQFEEDENYFAHLDVVDAQKIVDKLNELSEENEELRRELERVCVQNALVSDELNVLKRLTLIEKGRRFLNE